MVKIDVQGAEKMIFEGCNDLLKNTSIIFTEISFNSLYNNDILLASLLYTGGAFPAGPNYTQTVFLDEVQDVIDNHLGADGTIQRVNIWSDIP